MSGDLRWPAERAVEVWSVRKGEVGDGVAFKVTPIAISTGVTPRLTTSTTIKED